jgi:hypothetical protein
MDMELRVGHFVWVAGILLMLLPAPLKIPESPQTKWLAVVSLAVWIWWGIPRERDRETGMSRTARREQRGPPIEIPSFGWCEPRDMETNRLPNGSAGPIHTAIRSMNLTKRSGKTPISFNA